MAAAPSPRDPLDDHQAPAILRYVTSSDFALAPVPSDKRGYELWLQHCAGFILMQDVRAYARDQVPANLDSPVKQAALNAINNALYGVMMIGDGMTGALRGTDNAVELHLVVRHVRTTGGSREVVDELDLADGDGACMGFHSWVENDFGEHPVAQAT